jgi:3'-5' exonuclease
MLDKVKEENVLFLDIETVGQSQEYAVMDERMKQLWAKKMQWQCEKEGKTPEELYERAGIWAEFGRIVCISAGYLVNKGDQRLLRLKSFYGHDEKILLEHFSNLLDNHFNKDKHLLCAHNGKEFDFPYISRRMLVHGLPLPKILDNAGKKPWDVNHLDTMELWRFGDYKHYTSLDLLSAIFKIPSPKAEMDGSMVHKIYWQENDLQKIAEYCQKDVITICKLFLKYKGILQTENIHIEIASPDIAG